jgi:hypothetical protein
VRAALRAAAERPAAPLVRAAVRAASERSAAVRREVVRVARRERAERDAVLLGAFFSARETARAGLRRAVRLPPAAMAEAALLLEPALTLLRAGPRAVAAALCARFTLRAFTMVRLSAIRPPPVALRRVPRASPRISCSLLAERARSGL